MFCVDLKRDCRHVASVCEDAGAFLAKREQVRQNRCDSKDCTSAVENWLCTSCFRVHCGRHERGHAAEHAAASAANTRRAAPPTCCIAIGLADLSVWCYRCDSYIACDAAEPIVAALHEDKFGALPPSAIRHTDEEQALIKAHAKRKRRGSKKTRTATNANDGTNDDDGDDDDDDADGRGAASALIDPSELNDEPSKVARDALALAQLLRGAASVVWFTGAGISTSSGIPDFRGPDGIWTMRQQGRAPTIGIKLETAEPTFTHRFIAQLVRAAPTQHHVVSQNVDGLHGRSGVDAANLSELHGNAFHERCEQCATTFARDFDVVGRQGLEVPISGAHATGRKCSSCSGALRDTIVSFGEQLPAAALATATAKSAAAAVYVVLGSSLRVTPAADLPALAMSNGATLVIVNKQPTPLDDKATLLVHADIDEFLGLIEKALK